MTRIQLWNGDICQLEVDAIVNPANPSLWMATGVGASIKAAAGDEVEFAAVRQAPVFLGDAIVTPAGRLAARIVIHAVSLDRDRRTSAAAIEGALRSAFARARELETSATIAIPALGTGVGGFPLQDAAAITVATVRDELTPLARRPRGHPGSPGHGGLRGVRGRAGGAGRPADRSGVRAGPRREPRRARCRRELPPRAHRRAA